MANDLEVFAQNVTTAVQQAAGAQVTQVISNVNQTVQAVADAAAKLPESQQNIATLAAFSDWLKKNLAIMIGVVGFLAVALIIWLKRKK